MVKSPLLSTPLAAFNTPPCNPRGGAVLKESNAEAERLDIPLAHHALIFGNSVSKGLISGGVMSKILIVDNELDLVAKLEAFLSAKGYEIVGLAVSGRQAVIMASDLNPDLVLMEIKLAGDMDGITAVKKIKSLRDTPVVFVTWYGNEKILEKAVQAHPDGYVLKPYRQSQVQAAIEIALDKKNRKPQHDNTTSSALRVLTPAEMRVANLIKDGKRTREIAR